MNYCSHCGAPVALRIPEGDDRPRYLCSACGRIYYQNPKMVVGCIPRWENKVLMCRRNIEPQKGKWTLPAGYLENGETVMEGACRETKEEAGAAVFAFRQSSERSSIWWRRRELNPRPWLTPQPRLHA